MSPISLIFYGLIGYVFYLFLLKLNSQLEQKILQELIKEIYLCDCESGDENQLHNGGRGDITWKKTEIPVMKLYQAPNKTKSKRVKPDIEPKRSKSAAELSQRKKESNLFRRLSVA